MRLPSASGLLTVLTAAVMVSTTGYGGVTPTDAALLTLVKSAQVPPPVLGAKYSPTSVGFGEVRPGTVDLGGTGIGIVREIRWDSWGGPMATGSGTAGYATPDQPSVEAKQEPAKVVAYDLGNCQGEPAYVKVTWFFPQHDETFEKHEIASSNACTGP